MRYRLNVMQGGASVARCSTARAVLCQESASDARAFARVLRGFERNDRFAEGTVMRRLPSEALLDQNDRLKGGEIARRH